MTGQNSDSGLADGIPAELAARGQWIAWRNECRGCGDVLDPPVKECPSCGEKATKRPIDPETGSFARVDDPETWGPLDAAAAHYRESDCHGVGFVFTDDDPISGVDFDDVRDPETGEIDDWVLREVKRLASYTEVSPSGTGLHTYVFGDLPDGGNRSGSIEMYDTERYFTVTGDRIPQSPNSINFREAELAAVHEGHVSDDGSAHSEVADFHIDDDLFPEEGEVITNDFGEAVDEVAERDEKLAELLSSEEAGYESASEADMAAASKLWFWRFGRQEIAKIIRKHRARPKVIGRDDYLELTIGKAATGEQYDPRPGSGSNVEILDDRETFRSIDAADFPGERNFVLDKPPREGGSHASIAHLSRDKFIALVSRHAIAEHHLEILEDVMPDGGTAVHLVGKHRACRNSHKESCPLRVSEYEDLLELKHEVMDAIHENRIITYDDAPDRFCRKQFINEAAEIAHAVVTVPELLEQFEFDPAERRLLIDEEQALSHFRPDSTEIVRVEQVYEPDGTRSVQVSDSNLSRQFDAINGVRESVYDDWNERRKQAESEGRGWHKLAHEKDIVNAVAYLNAVSETLGVSEIVAELERNGESTAVADVMREIVDRVESIPRPSPQSSPDEFRAKLDEHVAKFFHNEEVNPGAFIEAVLYGYDDRPFDFKMTGGGYTLRMIGGREVFHPTMLSSFKQIGVIAGPEGELFFNDLDEDATVIEITDFRYADDFVVVPMGRKKNDEMESPQRQRHRARRVSKLLNDQSHPHLAVAGTKERAEAHHSALDAGTTDIIANPTSPAKDIFSTWSAGGAGIIYENSAVSRGIDAPAFDISAVVSSGFATPYWEARKAHYYGEDDDEYHLASQIESELKARELTNAVLRPAPTRNIDEYYGTKFIVLADWDVPRLRYLQDSVMERFADAESAANFLKSVTVGGGQRISLGRIYDYHDGDERAFIEEVTKREITETKHTRPTYDIETLDSWRNNWYFSGGETVETVEDALPTADDVWYTRDQIQAMLPGEWQRGRIWAALNVLEKMGRASKSKESDNQNGRPKTLWTLETHGGL